MALNKKQFLAAQVCPTRGWREHENRHGIAPTVAEQFRIDESHSNAFTEWKRLGAPQQPSPQQITRLEKAGRLSPLSPQRSLQVNGGVATMNFRLPRQAVSLLIVEWNGRSARGPTGGATMR